MNQAATEDQRWRKRALEAETLAKQLGERLTAAQGELSACREALDACERRHQIDLALWESGATDLETARLLTEVAVSRLDAPDVKGAVEELRQSKPFLFRGAPAGRAGAASAVSARSIGDGGGGVDLAAAAEQAALSGDRAALLRYLRLRRGGF